MALQSHVSVDLNICSVHLYFNTCIVNNPPNNRNFATQDKHNSLTFAYLVDVSQYTVKPVFKTIWEIGTTWELRTATSVPRSIHYIEMDLRNKTTS